MLYEQELCVIPVVLPPPTHTCTRTHTHARAHTHTHTPRARARVCTVNPLHKIMAVTAHCTNEHMHYCFIGCCIVYSMQYISCKSSGWHTVGLCLIATLLAYINIDTMAAVNMVQWFFISAFQSLSLCAV